MDNTQSPTARPEMGVALDLIVDFIGWVERFTGKLPESQCDEMFDLYGRARALHLRMDPEGHEAARVARFEAAKQAEQSA
jgi:hypothetical protein